MTVRNELIGILKQLDKTKAETDRLHGMINDFYCITLYQKYDKGNDITFDDLEKTEPNEYYPLPSTNKGRIITKKTVTKEDHLIYKAVFDPMTTLKRHFHSNCDELIEVITGTFTAITGIENEGTLKTFVLNKGETLLIGENTEHQVTNKSINQSQLNIKFIKI